MSNKDAKLYEKFYTLAQYLTADLKQIIDITLAEPHNSPYWNTIAGRNELFVLVTRRFRSNSAELLEVFKLSEKCLSLVIFRTKLTEQSKETLGQLLKPAITNIFISAEELVTHCVQFMHQGLGSPSDLSDKAKEFTKNLTMVINCNKKMKEQIIEEGGYVDLDTLIVEPFKVRKDPEFEQRKRAHTVEPQKLQEIRASIAQNNNHNSQNSSPNNTRGGPSQRGRGRGGRQLPPISPDRLQEARSYAESITKKTIELQQTIINTDVDDLESCSTAAKFVPVAKSLLAIINQVTEILGQRGVVFRRLGVKFLHMSKDLFMQPLSQKDKDDLENCKREFLACMRHVLNLPPPNNQSMGGPNTPRAPHPNKSNTYRGPSNSQNSNNNTSPPHDNTNNANRSPPSSSSSAQNVKWGAPPKPSGSPRETLLSPNRNRPDQSQLNNNNSNNNNNNNNGESMEKKRSNSDPPAPSPAAPQIKPLTKEEKREKSIQEIYDSEITYFKSLQRLIWMYKKPLLENARSSDPVISEREISNIFSNIESMFQFNKQLIKDLQRYLESPESTTIGDIFIEVAPMMKLYSQYINNYDLSVSTLLDCKSRSAFNSLLETFNTLAGNMDISSFLIQPVQRLPRYEMLLGALIKNTEENHQEYPRLVLAQQKIKEINDELNDSKRRAELRDEIYKIHLHLDEKPIDFTVIQPGREIKRFGFVQSVNPKSKKPEKRLVYIFNDVILVVKMRSTTNLKFKSLYPLDAPEISVKKGSEDPKSIKINKGINFPEEVWILETPEIAQEWLNEINNLVDFLRSN